MKNPAQAELRRGTPLSVRLRYRFFQFLRSLIDSSGCSFDDFGYSGNLDLSFFPFFFVHVFADGGDGLGSVAGVGAGSVDLIFEPWTLGESFFVEEQAWNFHQVSV